MLIDMPAGLTARPIEMLDTPVIAATTETWTHPGGGICQLTIQRSAGATAYEPHRWTTLAIPASTPWVSPPAWVGQGADPVVIYHDGFDTARSRMWTHQQVLEQAGYGMSASIPNETLIPCERLPRMFGDEYAWDAAPAFAIRTLERPTAVIMPIYAGDVAVSITRCAQHSPNTIACEPAAQARGCYLPDFRSQASAILEVLPDRSTVTGVVHDNDLRGLTITDVTRWDGVEQARMPYGARLAQIQRICHAIGMGVTPASFQQGARARDYWSRQCADTPTTVVQLAGVPVGISIRDLAEMGSSHRCWLADAPSQRLAL